MTAFKALVAAAVAAIGSLITIVGPGDGIGSLALVDWLVVLLAVLGSGGVTWYVANGPGHQYAKAVVGGLTAGVTALIAALADSAVTDGEWLVIALAVLAGAGLVSQARNAPPSP